MSESKLDNGQWAILVPKSAAPDPEDLHDVFIGWIDFLRDDLRAAQDELPADALEVMEAVDYLGGAYSNFHATHFHNRVRNDEVERLCVARRGLDRIGDAELAAIFDQAFALFEANRALWDQPMGNGTDAKRRAEEIMKTVDQRFVAHPATRNLTTLFADAIRNLPSVRVLPDNTLATLREMLLAESPAVAEAEAAKAAKAACRAEEEAVASRLRTQNMLKDPVSYAAEALSKRAGFTDVVSPPGEAMVSSDGSTEGWTISLRGHGHSAQSLTLARKNGWFFLLDPRQDVIAKGSESELERERLARLGGAEPPRTPPTRPAGFGRFFGRKGL